ncbi:MAG TPA: DUF898 family protein [Alphaproteobacteria bacterium]|nr:DUF898 family protein [Alphaproteobacteria bacterium]
MTTLAARALPQAAQGATTTVGTAHTIDYVGPTGTLYLIFIKNLLLSLVTLGIYRFWAKTRLRRFLWSNTRLNGEALEYTGTGKELFLGFLKAVLVLVPTFGALELLEVFLDGGLALALCIYALKIVLILGLIYAGTFAARRYRMSRTTWRGIRLQQLGSMWRYAGMAMIGSALTALTLTLYGPFNRVRLMRYEAENLRFGSGVFRFTGEGRTLFASYANYWGMGLVATIVAIFATYSRLTFETSMLWDMELWTDPEHSVELMRAIMPAATVPLALLLPLLFMLGLWYQARTLRFYAENLHLESLSFGAPRVSGGAIFWLLLSNFLIKMLSLGLLYPITVQRTMRFWCSRVELNGPIDFARITQAKRGPRTGEGLAGFFDIDAT